MSELLDLNWDVFVTPGIPAVTSDLPPGTTQLELYPEWGNPGLALWSSARAVKAQYR